MAKTIRPIICPTCGSNKKTEIKPDYFVCESCKTEYYLDSDDVNIIHTNKPATESYTTTPNKTNYSLIAGIIIAFIIFAFYTSIFTNNTSTTADLSTIASKIDLEDDELMLLRTKNNELIFVNAGIEQTGDYENRKEKLVVYFDDSNGKNIKKQELDFSVPKNKASFPLRKKYFSNGECYLIFNEKTLFKIDADLLEMRELKQDFFNAPEFDNGIAKIEEQYYNDAFKILTMDGKSYVYLPVLKKIYTPEQFRKEEENIPPNADNTTMFTFKSGESIYQLIKYVQKTKYGYPMDKPYFTEREGQLKLQSSSNNVISFEQFLPDRRFFNARLLGLNKELLIIMFTLDANDNSSRQVQALDVKTGKIRWTFDCSSLDQHVNYYVYYALSNSKITLLESNFGGLVIDNQSGKVLSTLVGR